MSAPRSISGKNVTDIIDFDLHVFLGELVKVHSAASRARALDLELSVESTVPVLVNGNAEWLSAILNKLVGNAIQRVSNGGVQLIVKNEKTSSAGYLISFTIADTGAGFTENEVNAINDFNQKSIRGENKTETPIAALVEARDEVLNIGSYPSFNSITGKGSVFRFNLLFAELDKTKGQKPHIHPEQHLLKGLTVLIAEDNKLNWVVLKKYLGNLQVDTDHAENGAVALSLAGRKNYDMIFMDLQMPVMDGVTAARIMREELKYTGPVIAITADDNRNGVPQEPFSAVLIKPVQQKKLAVAMISLVKEKLQQPE